MKNYSIVIAAFLLLIGSKTFAQCSSCTVTITGTDNTNHVINSGMTFCISPTGTCTGLITVTSGGILCNQGTINSGNLWIAGGTLNNYGTINTSNILASGQGVIYNYGSVTMDSLLVTNIYSTLMNYGSITGIRLGNSDYSSITNNGNITSDFMADSAAQFTNNSSGSFIVNYDFANAYNSGYNNYGYFKVTRDFYNSTNSTFETTCMGIVGRDWYNSALIAGPTSSCGGFNIAGGSYNSGSIGSSTTHVDLCDAGHPALGIDGPAGTIATTTTYCACSNVCVQTVGIKEVEANDIMIASVYPNPAVNSLLIEINVIKPQRLSIEIYDMMGKRLLASAMDPFAGENKLKLDISSLSQGTYILSINDKDQKQSKKMFSVVK